MGNCTFCGLPAGWFSVEHEACREKENKRQRDEALQAQRASIQAQEERRAREARVADLKQRLAADVAETLRKGGDLPSLEDRLLQPISEGLIDHADQQTALLAGWHAAVTQLLEDGVVTAEEEASVARFQERFMLPANLLDRDGLLSKIAKAVVLRRFLNKEPIDVQVEGIEGINLQKDEQPAWCFPGAQYLEDQQRREYGGTSQGVSVRLMSGLYYRMSAFKGEPIFSTERRSLGAGLLLVTDRNLYFHGAGKSMRIPFRKIVSFTPFSDGIGLVRDTATAKAQLFVTGDGWFTYNLITNLARNAG